jgi:hypothetical protein
MEGVCLPPTLRSRCLQRLTNVLYGVDGDTTVLRDSRSANKFVVIASRGAPFLHAYALLLACAFYTIVR